MAEPRLSAFQREILRVLGGMDPKWTLSGGAALALAYTRDRETRDLDLFWHRRVELLTIPQIVEKRLRDAGLHVSVLQSAPAFCRMIAERGAERVTLDLVGDRADVVEDPRPFDLDGVEIEIDAEHEILVNKLCALLGRAEARDLRDVDALLHRGGDLRRALADAPRKDGGFSPLTLTWVLQGLEFAAMPEEMAGPSASGEPLNRLRDRLVQTILEYAKPDGA